MYKLPDTLGGDIAKFGNLAKEYQEKKIETIQFKAFRVPMGIYEQRKDEVYMSRIRTTGGVIYPGQLLQIIEIAQKHTSDLLHITTRQEIQIQNLNLEEVEPILLELQETGLSTKGGGGNTVRNILVSANSGISKEEIFDTTPHAMALTTKLIAEPDSYLLPRKMKIAFSSDDTQIDYAGINDLGLVAKIQEGKRGFRVYVGGGGGSKPSVGWLLFDFIPESELFVVAEALKKMFSEHGNRKNKHKARIRYIFYRLGDEETLNLIKGYYEEAKKTTPLFVLEEKAEAPEPVAYTLPADIVPDSEYENWKKRYVTTQRQEGYSSILVPVVLGNLPLNDNGKVNGLKKLLHFVSRFGKNTLRFTTTQNIQLRHIPTGALPELYFLLKEVVPDHSIPLLANNIISCTGADTCRLGIALSKGLASAIRRELIRSSLDLDKLSTARIHISGCPNSCGQQLWADIGFSGKILRTDRIYPGYQVYLAANRNDSPRLAEPVGHISARDVPQFVIRLLAAYQQVQSQYPQLSAYLEKEGKTEAEKLLSEYAPVPLFDEDKNYYFDWGADTVFSIVERGAAECSAGLFDMIDLDLNYIHSYKQSLETETDPEKINNLLYETIYSASRMLLITRGAEPKTVEDTFTLFIQNFIEFGFVEEKFRPVVELAQEDKQAGFISRKTEILALADAVIELYRNMDDSLQFKNVQPQPIEKKEEPVIAENQSGATNKKFKDLRGVLCPMNFVLTKIELSTLQSGDELEILLDDGQPINNVPGSVRGEGHTILKQKQIDDYWQVVIKKK
ncbi:MAG: sulfurtransferase TusA family protein [Candidatus Symbiothrix sp.]|jgi:sulfite reductase (ferredoxin)|nr:sulfurtransferase TusA family protein [Candidatus Symbiothrix sp.]